MAKEGASLMLIGLGVGYYIPALPEPVAIVNSYVGMILILLGIMLMVKG